MWQETREMRRGRYEMVRGEEKKREKGEVRDEKVKCRGKSVQNNPVK